MHTELKPISIFKIDYLNLLQLVKFSTMSTKILDLCQKLIALLKDLWTSEDSDSVEDQNSRKRQKTNAGPLAILPTTASSTKVLRKFCYLHVYQC